MSVRRSRLIDYSDGHKVFGYACGNTLYDTNTNKERMWIDGFPDPFPIVPTYFQGRFIGWRNGKKLFGITSECYPQPMDYPNVEFVCKDVWCVPYGVTSVIRIKFTAGLYPITSACFDPPSPCPEAYLLYDGGRTWSGGWEMANGSVLGVNLVLTDLQDPDRPLLDGWPVVRKWEITFQACESPPRTMHAHISKYYPLTGGGQYGGTLNMSCCATQDAPDLGWKIEGFTNRRQAGKFIDLPGNRKLFATADCCSPDADCLIGNCCGCEVTPYEWTFSIEGAANGPGPPFPGTACNCHNGTWRLRLTGEDTLTGFCTWSSQPFVSPCVTSPASGMWTLRCDPANNLVTLGSQNTTGGGGTATYITTLDAWNCLGSNVLTLSGTPPAICIGWPATVTIHPL